MKSRIVKFSGLRICFKLLDRIDAAFLDLNAVPEKDDAEKYDDCGDDDNE